MRWLSRIFWIPETPDALSIEGAFQEFHQRRKEMEENLLHLLGQEGRTSQITVGDHWVLMKPRNPALAQDDIIVGGVWGDEVYWFSVPSDGEDTPVQGRMGRMYLLSRYKRVSSIFD